MERLEINDLSPEDKYHYVSTELRRYGIQGLAIERAVLSRIDVTTLHVGQRDHGFAFSGSAEPVGDTSPRMDVFLEDLGLAVGGQVQVHSSYVDGMTRDLNYRFGDSEDGHNDLSLGIGLLTGERLAYAQWLTGVAQDLVTRPVVRPPQPDFTLVAQELEAAVN